MLLMAATFTACTEDFKDWASPQANSPEDAITIPGFTASAVAAQNLDTEAETVPTFSLSSTSLPEGFELGNARIELTPQGLDDATSVIVNTTLTGLASTETLQDIVVEAFGRRPTVRTFDGHVLVNAVKDGQAVYIDAGNIVVSLTPKAPYIAQNYYVVGGTKDWAGSAATKEQKFQHSDADVYDDPVFTIVIDGNPDGDTWFAIGDDEGCDAIAQDGDWSKLLGIVGGDNNATTGKLDYRYNMGADNSFCVSGGAKKIKITIDMMESTFEVTKVNISDAYYLIGGPGDWNAEAAWTMAFTHSDKDVFDDPVFTYVFPSSGGEMWFAFGDAEAIDAVAAGDWTQLYGYKGDEALSGDFDRRSNLGGDYSFHVDGQAKFYRFVINMAEMTYTITPLNFDPCIYFIGATDGWANAEQKLALTDESGIYTGFIYCADPNGWGNEFKFQKEAGNWDTEINTGHITGGITGDFGDGGGNFKATAGEGVYYVTFDMGTMSLNAVKITNMNLVGDFNGWNAADDAQQMTWDAENYCYVITGAGVTAAGWKFTTNNSWDINLGGTVDNLVANGDNLGAVGTTIKLYPTRRGSDNIYCTVE